MKRYPRFFRVFRAEDFEALAVRALMGIVEVAEHRLPFDASLVDRAERCLTLVLLKNINGLRFVNKRHHHLYSVDDSTKSREIII